MSTSQNVDSRKLWTRSRILRPSRDTTCTPMENSRTPQRAALRKVKKAQTSTNGRRIPVESHSSASKQSDNDRDQEGITVAIRMRPLNAKESTKESSASTVANRVWHVLPQCNSIALTKPSAGHQPTMTMKERINGRSYFAFDKTFGEQSTTREIYDGVAKGIVTSVVTAGLNGTIFAYGQTSSGKTYTMQGSGSIEDSYKYVNSGSGIVHMAATDIFSYIENTQDRNFLVRASYIEIYNEDVRDLLGNNELLQNREDPHCGVFVTASEEIVTDFTGLLEILFGGEKKRSVASTNMNERSSRSHTILRITIESRCKHTPDDESDENVEPYDGAVRVSTLNLVDLAGSESVRLTGATGDRQKEGGKINQSLLTLSRVIVGLGQPGKTHINFRDSKLTRILQPSLSGNARMAIICCATPSELYLEETRSTLMFASRAKLVKTHAIVNEVLDDRSLIMKLQKELAKAQLRSSADKNDDQVLALQAQTVQLGNAACDAEEKLKKLKASILNTGILMSKAPVKKTKPIHKKQRLSDPLPFGKTGDENTNLNVCSSTQFEVHILASNLAEIQTEFQDFKHGEIKKVELLKLLEEQCDAMKKMQTEGKEYQQELKESLQRFHAAETEIVALKAIVGLSIQKENGDGIHLYRKLQHQDEPQMEGAGLFHELEKVRADMAQLIDVLKGDLHELEGLPADMAQLVDVLKGDLHELEGLPADMAQHTTKPAIDAATTLTALSARRFNPIPQQRAFITKTPRIQRALRSDGPVQTPELLKKILGEKRKFRPDPAEADSGSFKVAPSKEEEGVSVLREELKALRSDMAQMMDVFEGAMSSFQPQCQDELQRLTEAVLSHESKATVGPTQQLFEPALCPVCQVQLNFLSTAADLQLPFKAGVAKAMMTHSCRWHREEPVWNALPKLDLDMRSLHGRSKPTTATVLGLVSYSLASSARAIRLPKTDGWIDRWNDVKNKIIYRIGYARRLCSECPIYLRGRTNFLGATGETLAAQRLWLKNEAAKYLDDLCINTMSSPPSEHWYSITTAARKRNLVQIFFLDAQFHRECRLLPPEMLPPSEHFRINRSI